MIDGPRIAYLANIARDCDAKEFAVIINAFSEARLRTTKNGDERVKIVEDIMAALDFTAKGLIAMLGRRAAQAREVDTEYYSSLAVEFYSPLSVAIGMFARYSDEELADELIARTKERFEERRLEMGPLDRHKLLVALAAFRTYLNR